MADSILSSLLSKSGAFSIAKSTDKDKNNLAAKLKVSQVSIQYRSRPMRHMREDGISIVDARVIDSTLINFNVFCSTLDEVNAVNNILKDRDSTYTVSTRGLVFTNMTMQEMGISQTAEMLTASPVQFSMKQLRKQGPEDAVHPVVEQAPDSSIMGLGLQSVTQAKQTVTDLFLKVTRG
jgi:hypothetical protein